MQFISTTSPNIIYNVTGNTVENLCFLGVLDKKVGKRNFRLPLFYYLRYPRMA